MLTSILFNKVDMTNYFLIRLVYIDLVFIYVLFLLRKLFSRYPAEFILILKNRILIKAKSGAKNSWQGLRKKYYSDSGLNLISLLKVNIHFKKRRNPSPCYQ